jgi:hypothetical protein
MTEPSHTHCIHDLQILFISICGVSLLKHLSSCPFVIPGSQLNSFRLLDRGCHADFDVLGIFRDLLDRGERRRRPPTRASPQAKLAIAVLRCFRRGRAQRRCRRVGEIASPTRRSSPRCAATGHTTTCAALEDLAVAPPRPGRLRRRRYE